MSYYRHRIKDSGTLEDRRLVWKFRRGNKDALRRIYEKYKDDLLVLAITLSNDKAAAEDVVHDVFVCFAQSVRKLQLRGSLRSYLSVSVANRVRNLSRGKLQRSVQIDTAEIAGSDSNQPERLVISAEQSERIKNALFELPFEQQEAITLHLLSGLRFREIARIQSVSVNTIQSRYRYGLEKLRFVLDGEAKK